MNNIEYLSGEYNRGFTAGLKAIQEIIDYVQPDLANHHKKLTPKLLKELLNCCITNRERIRESVNGFIRYNGKLEKFEFYEPAKNKSDQNKTTCETCKYFELNEGYGWCTKRQFACISEYACNSWINKTEIERNE